MRPNQRFTAIKDIFPSYIFFVEHHQLCSPLNATKHLCHFKSTIEKRQLGPLIELQVLKVALMCRPIA
jgi:hypothetical protein